MAEKISVSDLFLSGHTVVESPLLFPPATLHVPAVGSRSTLETSLSKLHLEEKLCKDCRLLDFQKIFFASKKGYDLPDSPTNFGCFPGRFCWSVYALKRENCCPFCHLIMRTLSLNSRFEAVKDGIIVGSRISLYSKEADVSLPNLHFLSLAIQDHTKYSSSVVDYGYAIGVSGTHEIILPNTVKAVLEHFYPYLPPGMTPLSTTDEQARRWDAWRLKTATEYEVSVMKFDGREVSAELIKGWLKCCESEHTTWCIERMKGEAVIVPGFRVIDVISGNIVDGPEECRYMALSYVWGQVHQNNDYFRLLEVNYHALKEAGALFKQFSRLPDTIKDAILLCQKLGERYLWIDSLCIIQDSISDKAAQIAKMNVIYRRAVLTIIAAAGSDANAGLPGLRPDLIRRASPEASISNLDLVAIPKDGEFEINNSIWNSRAWTFQERVLSSKLLRFTSTAVTYECQSACWRDDFSVTGPAADHFRLVEQERKQQEMRQNFHDIISVDMLQFEKMVPRHEWTRDFRNLWTACFSQLVRDYTKRKLTVESDILDAFKGIEVALTRSMGPFHWGLPRHLLGQSLCWASMTDDLKTREGFPSFSWAGWVFGEGNYCRYPDFLMGPLPGYSIFDNDGYLTYWNDDCLQDPFRGIRQWHDALLFPKSVPKAIEWDKVLNETLVRLLNGEEERSLSSLIFFWSSVVTIPPFDFGDIVAKEEGDSESEEEDDSEKEEEDDSEKEEEDDSDEEDDGELEDGDEVEEEDKKEEAKRDDDGQKPRKSILEKAKTLRQFEEGIEFGGTLEIQEWKNLSVEMESREVQLVYLGNGGSGLQGFCFIFISWKDGIARRILPQVLIVIDPVHWKQARPVRKLVVLG